VKKRIPGRDGGRAKSRGLSFRSSGLGFWRFELIAPDDIADLLDAAVRFIGRELADL